jgi:hypothetical protein
MLVIDVLLILGGAILVGGAIILASIKLGPRLDRALAERRTKALGRRNAQDEALVLSHVCIECGRPIDPEVDIYDHGAWWHRSCWDKVQGGEIP